jgi:hypothetical protein
MDNQANCRRSFEPMIYRTLHKKLKIGQHEPNKLIAMNVAFKDADFSVNPLSSVHWIGSDFFLIRNFSIESIILQTTGSTVIPR